MRIFSQYTGGQWGRIARGAVLALACHSAVASDGLPLAGAYGEKNARAHTTIAQLGSSSKGETASSQGDLDALIKAAKAEGTLTFYSAPPENVAKRIADAFTAKYGVKAQFVRLTGVALQSRFSAEAETGNVAADLVIVNGSHINAYALDGIKKGWVESISDAALPVLKSGEFPSRFNKGATAVIHVAPWLIVFNTDKVKGADIPRDWLDLLNPKWKGQLIIPDPRSSGVYIEFWATILDKHGETFLNQLRGQNLRSATSGFPAVQALGAGEAVITGPNISSVAEGLREKGAPIGTFTPDYTTGVEQQVILTARSKAKNPNAARLFANYLMSREGNEVFRGSEGVSIYDTSRLPKDYQAPRADSANRKQLIEKLLGL